MVNRLNLVSQVVVMLLIQMLLYCIQLDVSVASAGRVLSLFSLYPCYACFCLLPIVSNIGLAVV
jgi:hypothetical protein